MRILLRTGTVADIADADRWEIEGVLLIAKGKRNVELAWFDLDAVAAWWYDNIDVEVSRP